MLISRKKCQSSVADAVCGMLSLCDSCVGFLHPLLRNDPYWLLVLVTSRSGQSEVSQRCLRETGRSKGFAGWLPSRGLRVSDKQKARSLIQSEKWDLCLVWHEKSSLCEFDIRVREIS